MNLKYIKHHSSGIILFFQIILIGLVSSDVQSQGLYAIDIIQKIEISFDQSNWDYILDTNKKGKDGYTVARWVKINGVQFDSAGVKYKGNSSYDSTRAKNPLHIELDYVKNQDYQGYKDIKLSNGFNEPSFIREALSYSMLQNYMQAPVANFAQVYINGQYMGLYTNVEAVTKTFVDSRFFSNNNSFFFMDNGGCNLVYKGPDSALYYFPYTIKSDYGWADLVALCNTLKNNINGIENILDVDRALWMLAFTNVSVTLDSYLGGMTHNYYLYEDHNGRFNSIIWDLNGGFGVFNKSYPTGPGLTVSQMQTMSPMLHSNDSVWSLVKNLFAVPMYKRMYIAHARTIVNENFAGSSYYTNAQELQNIIDTAVLSDTKKFFTYSEFLNNLTTTVVSGTGKIIPGITLLMDTRTTYLNSTTEFQQVPPTISNILPSNTFPLINSNIYITANVTNATAVFLGMRYSVMEKFTRMIMYDDGTHGDGAAADGTYGISVPVTSPEVHYYIYAENNNAGIFSPPRAEHEWYTLNSDYATVTAGAIVINELMAVNGATIQNGLGNFSDWLELYNTSADTLSLSNLYLSDDFLTPAKWQFPSGTAIPPSGYITVWADNDISATGHHAGFKLSGTGEQMILSYANGTVIDSVSFPAQTSDISYSRCPDGTGFFAYKTPSFNASNNCSVNIAEITPENAILIIPNPSPDGMVNIISPYTPITGLKIYDFMGKMIFSHDKITGNLFSVNLDTFGKGIYFFRINDIVVRKIAVE